MAESKKISVDTESDVPETESKVAVEGAKKVDFSAPFVPGLLEDDVFVGVDGKNYIAKRGENIKVPPTVAYAVQHSERLKVKAAKEAAKLRENANSEALK